jgi:hypothetical protein
MRAIAVVALIAMTGVSDAAPWTAAGEGGVTIDWSAGALRARGVGPADRHAPSPAVARVAARRAAETQARARLLAAARKLPVAGGGTVGAAVDADAAAAARLTREIERAPAVAVDLGTDGSAKVTLALGTEAIRQALAGPRKAAADDGPAVMWIIDAARAKPNPAIGLALDVGGARWDGPVVWMRDDSDAVKLDAGDVVRGTAASATKGVLAVSGPTGAPPAGALVVVVVPEKKPR